MSVLQNGKSTTISIIAAIRIAESIYAGQIVTLVAIREIAAGEKLTFNYLTTEWDMAEPFACQCGAPDCFKDIAGFRHLPLNRRISLEPLLTPFLRRKLREAIP